MSTPRLRYRHLIKTFSTRPESEPFARHLAAELNGFIDNEENP